MIIPAQDVDELWDRVSNFVHGHYDVRKETVIVINGDRASWIRKGKSTSQMLCTRWTGTI